jgi:hypothetical protein
VRHESILNKKKTIRLGQTLNKSNELDAAAAAVEALRKKERQDETQFTAKIGGKFSLGPSYFLL